MADDDGVGFVNGFRCGDHGSWYDDAAFRDDIALLVPANSLSLPATDTPRSDKKRRRPSLRDELVYLRAKRDELATRLEQLQALRTIVPLESEWAERAVAQAHAAQGALRENAQLRELLEDQLKLVGTLQRAFTRRPKLCELTPLAPWKVAAVGATDREATLLRILDAQYDKLATAWVRQQLHAVEAASDRVKRIHVEGEADRLVVHSVLGMSWPVDFTTMGDLLWRLVTTRVPDEFGLQSTTQEVFGASLTYARFVVTDFPAPFPPIEGRVAARRYIEADRVVLVLRSIAEDALQPWDPAHLLGNECTCIVVKKQGDGHCRVVVYGQLAPPALSPQADAAAMQLPAGAFSEFVLDQFQSCTNLFESLVTKAVHELAQSTASTK
ncbi:hypothetical protein ACHHYP_17376 [Achlya hypogyna]|uniref:START domain-containing protein n=1 Tax=Achlya hypogyna TaxID=1202772 RepID=A0A1V9Y4P2_ACHHY|nr:hypothetical protein ACHHYP_17376 [Achlya hypogyna]